MTTRTKTTIMLIVAVPLSFEVWKFWEGNPKIVNPWLHLNYPLSIQWFVKFAGIQFGYLLTSMALFRLSRMNEPVRIASLVLVILSVFDLAAFFWNFNKNDYSLVYLSISAGTLLYAFYHNDAKLWGQRQYYRWRRKAIRYRLQWDRWVEKRKRKSVPVETFLKKQTMDV